MKLKNLILALAVSITAFTFVGCDDEEDPITPPVETDGKVYVTSTPTGAQIFVGQNNSGKVTPDSVQLAAGTYNITLKIAEYFDTTFSVTITVGETTEKNITLVPTNSSAMVIHTSPDAPGVDILVDNAVASTNLTYLQNTPYVTLPSGTRNIKVNVTGTSTTVIEGNIAFAKDKSYSIFAVNSVANIEPLVLEDNLATPAAGKVHVRFIHLSPDAPAVDITLADGTVIFGDYTFKEASNFTPLDGGSYNLQVRLAGTTTVVLDLGSVTLPAGKILTVYARGFVAGIGAQEIGASIIENN